MPAQDDVNRWAALVTRAYAGASAPGLSSAEVAQLTRSLDGPLADCIMLAIPPSDWPSYRIDAALARWEAAMRRRPSPKLGRVDYGRETVEMRAQSGNGPLVHGSPRVQGRHRPHRRSIPWPRKNALIPT